MIKLLSNTIDSLKNEKSKQDVKHALSEAMQALKESDSIQSFGMNALKAVASFATTKFLARA